jgi:DNA-binding transcriptional ArsR family regulator
MKVRAIDVAGAPTVPLARFFRVLGDPTRLAILERLLDGPQSVVELVSALGAPRSRVSNHLACLRWCGFVEAERRGRQVVYRVTDARVRGVLGEARELAREHGEHLAGCHRIGPEWI